MTTTRRILYVEDSVEFRTRAVREHLHDVAVTEVSSVEAALILIQQSTTFEFDTVLLDFELPDGTGMQVLEALRARGITARVIAVSADRAYNRLLVDAGADGAVLKSRFARLRRTVGLEP